VSVATAPATRLLGPTAPRTSLWRDATRRFRRHRLAMVGFAVLLFMVAAVLVGPFVYRVPINEIDFKAKLKGPSRAHPLGTDDLGQDLLARMLYGGRISLAVGVVAMLISITLGTSVGALAGQLGGAADHTLMRITDLFLSLPQLPLRRWRVWSAHSSSRCGKRSSWRPHAGWGRRRCGRCGGTSCPTRWAR
jgi:peptide/nickel transport system permease protein